MATATLTQPTITASTTSSIPDSESLYEVVDGQIQEKPPTAAISVRIASVLLGWLAPFLRQEPLGRASIEMLHLLDAATGLKRRPDLAYVSYERWPESKVVPKDDAWTVVPDLAVEVVSPSNTASEVKRKIREYFAAGVLVVWVVYPEEILVEVYESPISNHILDRTCTLDGGIVLPGFRLALIDLFKDAIA